MTDKDYAGGIKQLPAVRYMIYKRQGKKWESWDGPYKTPADMRRAFAATYDDGEGTFVMVKERIERFEAPKKKGR